MIVSRDEIRELLNAKKLDFSPALEPSQMQPHAVDLRLGLTFYISKNWETAPQGRKILTVDPTKNQKQNFEKVVLSPGNFFEIAPGESVIGTSREFITLKSDDLMGVLYPRSSINRRGIAVDMTGIVDAHYKGNLMIPLLNKTANQIIRVYPGERICQIVFQKLSQGLTETEALLHGDYQAKYNTATANEILRKNDADAEISRIKNGEIEF